MSQCSCRSSFMLSLPTAQVSHTVVRSDIYPFSTTLLLGGLFSSTPPNCPWGVILSQVDFEYFTGAPAAALWYLGYAPSVLWRIGVSAQ